MQTADVDLLAGAIAVATSLPSLTLMLEEN